MDATHGSLLIFFYIVLSFFMIVHITRNIRKQRRISIRAFFELYFFLIYGLNPIVMLIPFQNSAMDINNGYSYYHTTEPCYFYLLFATTVFFYVIYRISDYIVNDNGRMHIGDNSCLVSKKKIDVSTNRFFLVTLVLTLIGVVSLILWTKAYGYPWDIIKHANAIRSGHDTIQNSLTFLKPFCSFVVIGFYCNLIMIKKTKFKILNILLMILNFASSMIFLLANDSRMFILVFFLCIFLYYKNKNINLSFKSLVILLSLAVATLFVLGKLDSITYYIRNGEEYKYATSDNAVESGLSEFGYTYRNGVNVLYFYDNDMLPEVHEIKDIENIITAWVPERFKPDREYLGDLNTSYYYGANGGIPTDIITASIYKFHSLGVLIMPIFIAVLLGLIEKFFGEYESEYMAMIYNLVGCNICLRLVAYYDLSNNLFSSFYIIVPTCIICLFCTSKRKEINDENNGIS